MENLSMNAAPRLERPLTGVKFDSPSGLMLTETRHHEYATV
jgi:hypothetical protein